MVRKICCSATSALRPLEGKFLTGPCGLTAGNYLVLYLGLLGNLFDVSHLIEMMFPFM